MKAFHQLSTIQNILASYKEDQPLHRFLAQFYRQNKQMGSKDRKTSSRLIYNYYRIGTALAKESLQNRLAVAEFLCNQTESVFVNHYQPDWAALITSSIEDKLDIITQTYPDFDIQEVFPFHTHLSENIDKKEFIKSHFTQPDLFVRIKKGSTHQFTALLDGAEIVYQQINETTFAFANGTKLDQLINDKSIYEIQDLSSQKTGDFFNPQKWDKWWDCCAASGGKSLMLMDQEPTIKLLVSDVRESILENLSERFEIAGIKNYQKKVLDLTENPAVFIHDYIFDGLILDAPCSGSGTWGRTPEMISQFKVHNISFFQELQRKIVSNVIPYLKNGKPLIYITCSVFKQENEEQVKWIAEHFNLKIESQELLKGYEQKADSMFIARLIN